MTKRNLVQKQLLKLAVYQVMEALEIGGPAGDGGRLRQAKFGYLPEEGLAVQDHLLTNLRTSRTIVRTWYPHWRESRIVSLAERDETQNSTTPSYDFCWTGHSVY